MYDEKVIQKLFYDHHSIYHFFLKSNIPVTLGII